MAQNICFNYLYRDAGNNKLYGSIIFTNLQGLALEEIEKLLFEKLISQQYFTPEDWKIPRLSFEGLVPSLDHEWNEFESLQMTDAPASNSRDILEFLQEK